MSNSQEFKQPYLNGKICSKDSDCLSNLCAKDYLKKGNPNACQFNKGNLININNNTKFGLLELELKCPSNMILANQTEGCIVQSLVYYQNSNVTASSFTSSSFNINPVYDYVLPVGANCENIPDTVSCGYGSICESNVCTINLSSSQQPKYPTNPNMGNATYKNCDNGWNYPTISIKGGSPSNYSFYWRYPDGCPCSSAYECENGYCDDDSKKCLDSNTKKSSCGGLGCIDF